MMLTEDMELVREYAAHNSEEAFATLVSRHVNLVYSVALRRLGDVHLAEEVTQAAFIILARKAGSLGPKTILSAWLCRTAQFLAARALRTQRRRQRREQESYMQSLLNQPEPETSPWPDIAPLLDIAMAELGEKDHSTIVLRFFEGKDMKQVGAVLGISEDAAKARASRAVEKLRKFFVRRGITLSAAVIMGAISAHSIQAAPAALAKSATTLALAKGATASGSTLSLIKGGLKLMTWAKAKIAIMACSAVLLGAGATVVAIESVQLTSSAAGPDIQGAWEGVVKLDFDGIKRQEKSHSRVVLNIIKTNGIYSATADVIDLGIRNIRLSNVTYNFPKLHFGVETWAAFEAKLNKDATAMTLRLGTNLVVLERTNTPDTVPERLTTSDFATHRGSGLQGYWEGELAKGPPAVKLNWKIAGQTVGGFIGEMAFPAVGANHWPIFVTYNRPKVTFKAMTGAVLFQGKINGGDTEITGAIYNSGRVIPVILKRTDYQDEPPLTESNYSFSSETDLQGHWQTVADVNVNQLFTGVQWRKYPLNLNIARLPDGTFSAALAAPLAALAGMDDPIPATDFQHPLPNVHLEWNRFGVVFDARLADGKLTGTWNQHGQSFTRTFERSQKQ